MDKQMVGKNIRFYRNQKGQSLRSCSRQIGISYQQLSRIERGGGTSTSTLERIADVLGVSIENLLREPEKNKQQIFREPRCFFPQEQQDAINKKLYSQIIKPVNDVVLSTYLEQIYKTVMDGTFLEEWEEYIFSEPNLQKKEIPLSKQELLQFSKKLLKCFVGHITHLSRIYSEDEDDTSL